MPLKSPEAARQINCGYWRLMNLIRSGRLLPPAKDSSGDYVWNHDDIHRARAALQVDRRLKAYRRRGAARAIA
jgi:hypothetical protein